MPKGIVNQIKYLEMKNHIIGIMPDGIVFYFDYQDYELVKSGMWHYCDGYLRSTKLGLMHRCMLKNELTETTEVDHHNRNRLDNRRFNIKPVTKLENQQNKSVYKNNKSGCSGVKWNPNRNKWQVQITINHIRKHLGLFSDLQDAIIARKLAEVS